MKTNIVNKRHVEYLSKWVITPKNGSAGDEGSITCTTLCCYIVMVLYEIFLFGTS